MSIVKICPNNEVQTEPDNLAAIDAAALGRALLAGAAVVSSPSPPPAGTLVTDAQLPVMQWAVGNSDMTGEPALVLTVPSGIVLTFVMPAEAAKAMGAALKVRGETWRPQAAPNKAAANWERLCSCRL